MKTSIEWLLENLINEPFSEEDFKHNFNVWNKAEEMHKQEIINAAQWMPKPYNNIEFLPELAKQYYKETYEK
jgi:hypothetical protein